MKMLMAILAAFALAIAAQAQTVNICDRTPQVRDAILEALEANNCAAVDSEALASMQELDLSRLLSLNALENNPLTALPDGVFDGLTGLQRLWLSENQLIARRNGQERQ